MTTERTPQDATERLIERARSAGPDELPQGRDGLTWEDLRHAARGLAGVEDDGLTWDDDGLTWDDAAVAAMALRAEATRPVPTDVATRHLSAMHAAATAVAPHRASRLRAHRLAWRRRIAGAAAAATAFTTLGGGAAVAVAQEAVPGDALYGVKRASEQVRLVIELDASGDAALHLQFAQRRLAEIQAAPEEADDLLVDALDSLAVAENDGDEETQEAAKAVGQGAIDALTALLDGKLPETASPRAREALQRNLDRKQAHQDAKESGAKGRDQAPGQVDEGPDGGEGRDGSTPGSRPDDAGPPSTPPGQQKKQDADADGN